MKITLKETTIEADAKELRESRTLTDCLIAFLKSAMPMGDEVDGIDEIEEIEEIESPGERRTDVD